MPHGSAHALAVTTAVLAGVLAVTAACALRALASQSRGTRVVGETLG
jgi:hypothetical protein